ncbi:MAG: hypothetical protein FWE99_06175 [Bacteroidales bacterium]|nr:hypothetical protein [Bacteroidales bacterium]
MREDLIKDIEFLSTGNNGSIAFARFADDARPDRKMENDTVFLKSMLKAKKEDEFRLKSEVTDDLGITHKKFQQYYSGVKVDYAEYLLHGKNGNIEVMNGDYQNVAIPSIEPTLSEPQALSKALEYIGAEKYEWDEPMTKQRMNDSDGTCCPKGELVIVKDYLTGSNAFKLSWKFFISSMKPFNRQLIYVDAINGDIIDDVSLLLDVNTPGTAQTRYSGTQAITCDMSIPILDGSLL